MVLSCVFSDLSTRRERWKEYYQMTPPDHEDLVKSVTVDKPVIANPGATGDNGQKLPRLAVLDCGIKYNIIRELCSRFEVVWCPASMPFQEIMDDWRPDALFASNGPGDPAHPGTATTARDTLVTAVKIRYASDGDLPGASTHGSRRGTQNIQAQVRP